MSESITITGNIATEPTHTTTPSGVSITRFRIASAQRKYDRSAERWVDGEPNWYSVSVFRRLADHAYGSLQKGERVVVAGRLRLRSWERDGRRGIDADIEAESLGHDLRFGTTRFRRADTSVAALPLDTRAGNTSDGDVFADSGRAEGGERRAEERARDAWAPRGEENEPELFADATPF